MQLHTVETFVLDSSELGDRLELSVALPNGRAAGSDRLPVVYVLDATFHPQTVLAASAWLVDRQPAGRRQRPGHDRRGRRLSS